jgi:hypothetical protein
MEMNEEIMDSTNQINTATIVPYPPTQFSGFPLARWSSPTIGKLALALAQAQAEFVPVPKNRVAKVRGEKNGKWYEYEYRYADWADILNMARPRLAKYELAFTQLTLYVNNKPREVSILLHSSNEWLASEGLELPSPGTTKPQEFGGYQSYYKRYDGSALLGIAADEDTDGPSDPGEQKQTASTSGHTEQPKPVQAAPAKRGRPANPPKEEPKATSMVPPDPPKNAGPQVANDDDVPDSIGNKPTDDERKEYQKRLKSFIAESSTDAVKAFVHKKVNSETTTSLTKREWDSILGDLDAAKAAGNLAQLLAVSQETK